MEFIGNYWFIWAIMVIAGFGYAIYNQIQRMKLITSDPAILIGAEDQSQSVFDGIGMLVFGATTGFIGLILLIISIIVNLR